MTTILVATDFSANAHWTTDYALGLARQLHTRLVLMYTYAPLSDAAPAPDWMSTIDEGQRYQTLHKLESVTQEVA